MPSKLTCLASLLAPFIYVKLRLMGGDRWPEEPAPFWVLIVLPAVSLFTVVYPFFLERQTLKEPVAAMLRSKGHDPRQATFVHGLSMMHAPATLAMAASYLGLSVSLLVGFAAVSFVGTAFWLWRYRSLILA